MIERFQGTDGRALLIKALLTHPLVTGKENLAAAIADRGELISVTSGTNLIVQDAEDNDLYLIITGCFGILVNGREMAQRGVESHVGEMALIEPTAKRSATVSAYKDSVVIKLSESQFSNLADEYPSIWKHMALELGERLRQRNRHVKTPNPRPVIFIASSVEGLRVAKAIELGLDHNGYEIKPWTAEVFGPSTFPIVDLEREIQRADFGIIIISPDDRVSSREVERDAPRDNVIFELGMCIGAFGRDRSFMVAPRKRELKIPTDLLGLTPLDYEDGPVESLDARLSSVCERLRRSIEQKWVK